MNFPFSELTNEEFIKEVLDRENWEWAPYYNVKLFCDTPMDEFLSDWMSYNKKVFIRMRKRREDELKMREDWQKFIEPLEEYKLKYVTSWVAYSNFDRE